MAVIYDTLRPELERVKTELERLAGMVITVGVQAKGGTGAGGASVGGASGDLLKIAGVHEYGCTITAKGKYLAIPLRKECVGVSPRSFSDTFVVESDGAAFICRAKKGRKNLSDAKNLIFLYVLKHSVVIPERSYIRASFDTGKAKIDKAAREAVEMIILEGADAMKAAEYVGMAARDMTVQYFSKIAPPKGALQARLSGWSTPLVVTGRLRNSITYRVEGG